MGPGGGAAWHNIALTTRSSSGRLSHLEPRSRAVRQAPGPIRPLLMESSFALLSFPSSGFAFSFSFGQGDTSRNCHSSP